MSRTRRIRLTKGQIAAISLAAFFVLVMVAIIIVNIFIPVRYLSAWFSHLEEREENTLRITFLDVGYGDCAVAELPDGKVLLIDGADGAYSNQLELYTVLNGLNIDYIDYLVLTSVRAEHCGGLAELFDYKTIGKAYIPYASNFRITDEFSSFVSAAENTNTEIVIPEIGVGEEGVSPSGTEYFFTFLSPSSHLNPLSEYADMNTQPTNENIDNASAVLWLEYGDTQIAFSSDARSSTFGRICDSYSLEKELSGSYCPYNGRAVELSECDIVTVSGHGNEDNTYALWYEALTPEYAILSTGDNFNKSFTNQSMSDVFGVGAKLLLTRESGNITFSLDGDGFSVAEEK